MNFHRLTGEKGRDFVHDLARLRLEVFHDFPYLYQGDLDYEVAYLETYFKAQHSFIFLVEDQGAVVGATTGIWAQEEEASFREPFSNFGLNPESVFYFGESILLDSYRGKGLGKMFFQEREAFARTLPFVKTLSFCAVERSLDHPLRPSTYQGLDPFWGRMGFHKVPGLVTTYEWKDRDEEVPTKKKMQYWIKNL